MPPRTIWTWAGAVGAVAVVDLLLTVHAHDSYHHRAGNPTVMPIGQLLGWVSTVALAVVAVIIAIGARNAARRDRDRYRFRNN